MRVRSFAIAVLTCSLCGLLVIGVRHWIGGGLGAVEALELEGQPSNAAEAPVQPAWGVDEQLGESPALSLADVADAATAEERQALGDSSSAFRVLVRAADSSVEIAGAEVLAISRVHQYATDGLTGEDGLTELDIPAGAQQVDLVISAEGYVTANLPSIDLAAGEHTQDLISSATIEGYVQLDGAPAATVHLWSESRREFLGAGKGEGEVGADRFFRFQGLPPGGYALGLELIGQGIDFVANVEVRPGDTETVDLRAPRPGELDLRIVRPGEQQEPVSGATVKLVPDRQGVPRAMESRIGQRSGETDEQGRWRVSGLSPGEWIVEATDGAAKVRRRIEITEGGRISEVQIVMRNAPSLIVRLQGTGGIDPSKLFVFAWKPDELNPAFKAAVRADGTFFFASLPANLRLHIRAGVRTEDWVGEEEARPTRSAFVRFKPREEPHELELQLTAQCTATVVVKKPDGSPWGSGAQLGGQAPAGSPEAGTYVFALPAGPAILESGGSHGFAKRKQKVFVKPGEENRFEVALRSVSEVRGSLVDTNGAALARLRVRARRQDVEEGQRRDYNTRTNSFGEFRLQDLPAGEFLLYAITRYGETGAVSAQARFETPRDSGAFYSLVLPYVVRELVTVGTILGRATTLDGERASRFRVQNLRGGTVSVDGDRFEIRDLRSGRFDLTLVADDCLPQVLRGVELAAGATIDLGTIEFAPATQVIVDVRGPDNRRLGDARIELRTRKADLQPGQKPNRHRIRDRRKDGRYQREKSPRGRFQLIVRRDGYETYRRNVTVREQEQQFFRMKLNKQDSDG